MTPSNHPILLKITPMPYLTHIPHLINAICHPIAPPPPSFLQNEPPWEPRAPARALPPSSPTPLLQNKANRHPTVILQNEPTPGSPELQLGSLTPLLPTPFCKTKPIVTHPSFCKTNPKVAPARSQAMKTHPPADFAKQSQSSSIRHFAKRTHLPSRRSGLPGSGFPGFAKRTHLQPPASPLHHSIVTELLHNPAKHRVRYSIGELRCLRPF